MSNLRKNEVWGLIYQFIGATSIGAGIYYAVWAAVRSIYYRTLMTPSGWEYLLFALFFGVGAILYSFGSIEIKEVPPSHKKRR